MYDKSPCFSRLGDDNGLSCMTYRINTDRLVLCSILLWVLAPPALLAWGANPPSPDNVRWLEQFAAGYLDFLVMGGGQGVVVGFLCAALIWLVHRLAWTRGVKIVLLFVFSFLCLALYGGSFPFALFYLPLALINPVVYFISVSKVE